MDLLTKLEYVSVSFIFGNYCLFDISENISIDLFAYQEPTLVPVPVNTPDGKHCTAEIPVQLPHKVLEYLLQSCDLQIGDETLRRYWQHLEEVGDEMAMASRPFRAMVEKPVVPVGLHGDDASMSVNNQP